MYGPLFLRPTAFSLDGPVFSYLRLWMLPLIVFVAGCGSGSSGGTSSNTSQGQLYDFVYTAVTGSATPDAAVGDTDILILTGAPPASRHLTHPMNSFFEADRIGGMFTIHNGFGGVYTFTLTGASSATAAESRGIFDFTTGDRTGTNNTSISGSLIPHVAPPFVGIRRATITSVATGSGANIGDTFLTVITPSGLLANGYAGIGMAGLVKSGTTWYAQISSWSEFENAVLTTKMEIDGSGNGAFLMKTGASTTLSFEFTTGSLVIPSAIPGAQTDEEASATGGTAPGYSDVSYILGRHPADTNLNLAIDATSTSVTVAGFTYQIYYAHEYQDGEIDLWAIRNYRDSTLTTADKRALEFVSILFKPNGVLTDGSLGAGLWVDPTPNNNGGSLENDNLLGFIRLVDADAVALGTVKSAGTDGDSSKETQKTTKEIRGSEKSSASRNPQNLQWSRRVLAPFLRKKQLITPGIIPGIPKASG